MDKFATAILDSVQQQQSTMIINGVPQGSQKVTVHFVKCNNCSRVLAQFNPGDPIRGIIDYIKTKLANDINYCPTCGSKLNYTADILEGQCTAVGATNESNGTESSTN